MKIRLGLIFLLFNVILVQSQQTYTLGGLFETDTTAPMVQAVANELVSAFRVACEQVKPTGWTLNCVYGNNATLMATQGVQGVVGTLQSQGSIDSALIFSEKKIPQISPGATSNDLSSMVLYPYFLRTIPADNIQGQALAAFIATYGWNSVALISTDDPLFTSVSADFRAECENRGIRVTTNLIYPSGTTNVSAIAQHVDAIKESSSRVIVALATLLDLEVVMRYAATKQLTGAGYAWISATGGAKAYLENGVNPEPVQGLISLQTKSGTGLTYERYLAAWLNKDPAEYPGSIFSFKPPTFSVAQTFDAVNAFVKAFDLLVAAGRVPNSTATLSSLKKINFTGSTGLVAFDGAGNSLYPSYDVVNIVGNQAIIVGTLSPVEGYLATKTIMWPGATTIPPLKNIYYLGGVFPTDYTLLDRNPILHDLGVELLTSFRIACEVVNSQPNLLQRAKFQCLYEGTAFDADTSIFAAQKLANASVIGLVGSIYSETSEAIANAVSTPARIPQISPAASSVVLSNRTNYPFFLRMSPSEVSQVNAMIELIKYFKWSKISTLAIGSDYFLKTEELLATKSYNKSITVTTSKYLSNTSDVTAIENTLISINQTGARVIFVSAFIQDMIDLYEVAGRLGMTGKGWAWLGFPKTTLQTQQAFVGHESALTNMDGFLAIRPQGGKGALYQYLISEWLARDPIQYPGLLQQGKAEPITWSAETFDAVFAYAHAVDDILAKGGDPTDGSLLYQTLLTANFTGATGEWAFDKNGDPYRSVFDILNFRDGSFVPIGQINLDSNNGTVTRTQTIVWPGGQTTTPADTYVNEPVPAPVEVVKEVDSIPSGVIVLIVLLGLAAVVATIFILYIFAKEKRTGKGIFIQMSDTNL